MNKNLTKCHHCKRNYNHHVNHRCPYCKTARRLPTDKGLIGWMFCIFHTVNINSLYPSNFSPVSYNCRQNPIPGLNILCDTFSENGVRREARSRQDRTNQDDRRLQEGLFSDTAQPSNSVICCFTTNHTCEPPSRWIQFTELESIESIPSLVC